MLCFLVLKSFSGCLTDIRAGSLKCYLLFGCKGSVKISFFVCAAKRWGKRHRPVIGDLRRIEGSLNMNPPLFPYLAEHDRAAHTAAKTMEWAGHVFRQPEKLSAHPIANPKIKPPCRPRITDIVD